MKKLQVTSNRFIVIILFSLFAVISLQAQCTEGSQCVPNAVIDRATAAAVELSAARDTITAFQRERMATDAERAAATRLIERLNAVIAVQDRLNVEYNAVINLYKSVVQEQAALIERLQKMLNQPKSAFQRFVSVLKTIATLLSGVALGRGL